MGRLRFASVVASVCLLSITCVLSGCGVSSDSAPRAIEKSHVPFDLLSPAQQDSGTSVPGRLTPVRIYLVSNDVLVAVQRSATPPVQLGATLAVLAQGPTDDEEANGITTKLRSTNAVLRAQIDTGIAHVDVDDAIDGLSRADQARAIAQIVFTATELTEVTGVQIESSGRPVAVAIDDGSGARVTRPLQRADFPKLAPPL